MLFGMKIHARNDEAVERSRRTRGFLFACLGGALAGELGVERVYLADNGPISLNLPINHQLLGAHVSRSTHPVFLARVNQLMALVFDTPIVVCNPLWSRTRVDILHLLRDIGLAPLIPLTNSCSRWSRLPVATPFCGACSQCVDRRFATLAAGLETLDPADRYATDVFWDHLTKWDEEMLAISYVRFAQRIVAATHDELMVMFPELFDAILPVDPDPDGTLEILLTMLRRHAQAVVNVLERQMVDAAARMARGELVPSCLVAVAASRPRPQPLAPAIYAPEPRAARSLDATPGASEIGATVILSEHVFAFDGDRWVLGYEGLTAYKPHKVAMTRIAYLLEHEGDDFTAGELLVATDPSLSGDPVDGGFARGEGLSIVGYGDGGTIGDRIWKQQLNGRVRELLREIDEARSRDLWERVEELDAEVKAIAHALQEGIGLNGKPRTFSNITKTQQNSVYASIHRIIPEITKKHPALGRHLDLAIHRKSTFSYRPDRPIPWRIALPPHAA
jgi:hypothetical protein